MILDCCLSCKNKKEILAVSFKFLKLPHCLTLQYDIDKRGFVCTSYKKPFLFKKKAMTGIEIIIGLCILMATAAAMRNHCDKDLEESFSYGEYRTMPTLQEK